MNDSAHGTEREAQARHIAAWLGIPDFVYVAKQARKGTSLREVSGDGLLIVGDRGAVLQVKARDPEKAPLDSQERADSWIRKHAAKARDQGLGTKRELTRRHSAGEPAIVSPIRATALTEDARRVYDLAVSCNTSNWPVIVVLDHTAAMDVDLEFDPEVIWFTFSDWRALHRRLRSVGALLQYCSRILRDRLHVPLGREVERYSALRAADDQFAASGPPTVLPFLAHPDDFDALGTDLFHDVIDKVWPGDGPIPWRSPADYRKIVEFLDSVSPEGQSVVGRWFLQKRRELASGQEVATGLFRHAERHRLVYGCSDREHWDHQDEWMAEFAALVALRHVQALESGAPNDSLSLGVGALTEKRGGRDGVWYFFLLLEGRDGVLPMPADLRLLFEFRYGVHNHGLGKTTPKQVGRNQPCPCMSGKKFERCCGR